LYATEQGLLAFSEKIIICLVTSGITNIIPMYLCIVSVKVN
jgi:hypothetical protein